MGDPLEAELRHLIRKGVWSAFPELQQLREWPPYTRAGGTKDHTTGTRILVQVLRQALQAWQKSSRPDAIAMETLLCLDRIQGRRVLNGSAGLRTVAGRQFDVGADQFYRQYEEPLICQFAEFLRSWELQSAPIDSPVTILNFSDLETTAKSLHRTLVQRFSPDMVITMSGPGSFAACYMMSFNARDIPVVMAVTFPRRDEPLPAEREFAKAAHSADAIYIRTTKWSVYLPGLVRRLPPGYRIALVDDRVLTGETQIAMRDQLTSMEYVVTRVALFGHKDAPGSDLLVGRVMNGPFEMPWGTARGRE